MAGKNYSKERMPGYKAVAEYLKKDPDATVDEIVEATGYSLAYVKEISYLLDCPNTLRTDWRIKRYIERHPDATEMEISCNLRLAPATVRRVLKALHLVVPQGEYVEHHVLSSDVCRVVDEKKARPYFACGDIARKIGIPRSKIRIIYNNRRLHSTYSKKYYIRESLERRGRATENEIAEELDTDPHYVYVVLRQYGYEKDADGKFVFS